MKSSISWTVVALLATALCTGNVRGQNPGASDGHVIERKTYTFPQWEQVANTAVSRYTTKAVYEKAVGDAGFEFQKLKYLSDGLKVVAYLYKPARTDGKTLPAIIFNRGSATRGDIAPEVIHVFHRLASEGFVIIAPMYRQSDGGEGRDELGGADVADLMNVLPLAKSLGFIDMNNLFMVGESRGGMMTYVAIKRGFPINAAAVFGAFTDLEPLLDTYPQAMLKQLWPDLDLRRDEIVKTRSAIHWPEQLNVPLLIMHGGRDSLSPSHSLALAQSLQKAGKTYELMIYAGDNHYLRRNQEDRDKRTAAWFRRHLKT